MKFATKTILIRLGRVILKTGVNVVNFEKKFIDRLLSADIVQFRSALRTEIFLRELTLSSTLSSNPKSSHSVDPQFPHKLLFYVH